jgi:hypothetical protein
MFYIESSPHVAPVWRGRGRGGVRDFRSKNPDLDLYCQPTRLLNTLFSTLFCTAFAVFLQLYPLAHNILIHP